MDVVKVGSMEEDISESFVCCICLDLLYKPIVLPCGHILCFWCVHKSMSVRRESHCPICRNAYNHFPTICQMLHFLLQKMYPVAYKRRESQVLEEEKDMGHYSPQFESPNLHEKFTDTPDEAPTSSNANLLKNQQSLFCDRITVVDVVCAGCKQLLFRPMVLNCGHVYCESCILHFGKEMTRCQVCQGLLPKGLPKVFLELVKFLEEHFPEEYALRRDTIQQKEVDFKALAEPDDQEENPSASTNGETIIHFAVGCDFCGMYPISGDRYKCVDCKESIGFDLCGHCYNTPSKLPGRFNQQHTSEHRFELVQPGPFIRLDFNIIRAMSGYNMDSTAALITGTYSSIEDSEDESTTLSLTSSPEENAQGSGFALGDGQGPDDSEPST